MRQKLYFIIVLLFSVTLPITVSNITSIKCSVFLHNMHLKGIKKSDTYILLYRSFMLIFQGFFDGLV